MDGWYNALTSVHVLLLLATCKILKNALDSKYRFWFKISECWVRILNLVTKSCWHEILTA